MLSSYILLLFGTLYSNAIVVSSQPANADTEAKLESMCLDTTMDFVGNQKNGHKWTPCHWTNEDILFNHSQPSYLRFSAATTAEHQPAGKMQLKSASFDITFSCFDTDIAVCGKAERAFRKAGDLISETILFREPVRVNATLMSFCKMGNECNKNMMTLGGSSPARAMPLMNDDGMLRLHPQALVKQFGLSDHPAFAPYDILSIFNADAPFWFEEDNVPIDPSEADFSFVILHEFMHGLGFYSGWNEYVSTNALTPDPSPFLANQLILMINPSTSAIHPNQFLESAMDRLLRAIKVVDKASSKPISDYTRQLNKLHAGTISELVSSPGFEPAKDMDRFATMPGSLGLEIYSQNEPVILETDLQPFQPGSSISHVSYANYTHTPDFLMRFMQDRGLTLQEAVKQGGGNGPIGPLLLRVFEEIGYATVDNPDTIPPLLIFQSQFMENEDGTNNNSTNRLKNGIRRKNQHHHHSDDHTVSSAESTSHTNLYHILFLISSCYIVLSL